MPKLLVVAILSATALPVFAQDMPPLINGAGATLRSLAGTPTLVTVVLNGSEAMDPNLNIVRIGGNTIVFSGPDREEAIYLLSSIKEIRVQDAVLTSARRLHKQGRSLRAEEQRVVDRAFARAREIYESANAKQGAKMRAAMLMAVDGDEKALEYLRMLASSKDLETELRASVCLYLAGDTGISPALIKEGLNSGNRRCKKDAALLASVLNDQASIPMLTRMLNDRDSEISVPAALALGRMGNTAAIPTLARMLTRRNDEVGNAAVAALSAIGGPEVAEQAKALLEDAEPRTVHRIALVLNAVGDPKGAQILQMELTEMPTLAREAAIVLAGSGVWDGKQFLMNALKSRYDEEEEEMFFRAQAALALVKSGDPTAITHVQELLRVKEDGVRNRICFELAALGNRHQIAIVQSCVESPNPILAISASTAAVAMARPDFRDRLVHTIQ
ncbi:MAG: hypothetical protein GWP08_01160 [Nitrospiraceae bacterium]|nr:hypothetical protein [Nitrospiraceae bacterium]